VNARRAGRRLEWTLPILYRRMVRSSQRGGRLPAGSRIRRVAERSLHLRAPPRLALLRLLSAVVAGAVAARLRSASLSDALRVARLVRARLQIAFRVRVPLVGVVAVLAALGVVVVTADATSWVYLLYVELTLAIGALAQTTLLGSRIRRGLRVALPPVRRFLGRIRIAFLPGVLLVGVLAVERATLLGSRIRRVAERRLRLRAPSRRALLRVLSAALAGAAAPGLRVAWFVRARSRRLAASIASAPRAHRVPLVRRLPGGIRISVRPRVALVGVVALLAAIAVMEGGAHATSSVYLLYVGVVLVIGAVAWTTLLWMLDAWRTPASLEQSRLDRDERAQPAYSFSLIVPARHEEAVLEATLRRLVTSTHPAFEVLVVVGHDDPGTRQVAQRVADRHPGLVKLVIDTSWPKSKPKALNAALPYCRGAITGVFDAEDDVHPGLLERVDQCFQRTDADVVQAGVQLMNFRSSWLTVRNVLEYYFWFRSRLHFHARQGFIPLGGNTVFIRTGVLRAVSGWDADCLAEDCELGVRLSVLGAHTVVFYEPELVTREECPPTIGAFYRQRTRWNQGYLQTLSKGYWRGLPLRQRALGAYTLALPYLMAIVWVMMPVALVTAIAVKAPVPITLISFLPVLPLLSTLAVEVVGLHEFCGMYGERASARDYGRLVLGLPVYQAVLAFAAARAVAREARGARGWEKTAHMGLHLGGPADAAGEPADEELTVSSWSARASGNGAKAHELGSGIAARALTPSLVTANGSVELETASVRDGGPLGSSQHVRFGRPVEVLERSRRERNGSRHSPRRFTADMFGAVGVEPLWLRLDAVSENGSASVRGIPPVALPGPRRASLGSGAVLQRAAALLRTAIASHTDLFVQGAVLTAVGIVQATNMLHWPAAQFDEGTYVGNAWAVQHGALAPYTYSYGHPPLCWLFIALWTWAMGIFGNASYSIDTGREFMFAVSLVSCSLLYTLARRLNMSRGFAACAVVLFALSPVSVFFHRAVLLDNVAIAWALAAFVLALTPRRRTWAVAASGACFAACVLSKETMLPILPALLAAAAQNADRRTRRYCLTLFGSFLVLVAAAYPLYATLKGELLPGRGHVSLVGTMLVQVVTRASTGSPFDPHSLAHETVVEWLKLDPWLVGAALVLSPIALRLRATRAVAFAYVIQVGMILRPGYLPSMYVIGLLPFAALIVAGTAQAAYRFATGSQARRRLPPDTRRWRAGAPLMAAATAACWLALVASAAGVGYFVAPRWMNVDRTAMVAKPDAPLRAAERWLREHIPHDKRVLLGDEYWIYLVEHGFDHHPMRGGFFSRTLVAYWPMDYDPAVKRHFPHGWRDFDYVVSTQAVRVTLNRTPTMAAAIAHSRLVVRFGRGDYRIEVRAIDRGPNPG
jgi:glycosyltransferase XagB